MPLYEFECKHCGEVCEFLVGISELDKYTKKKDNREINLSDLGLKCPKCKQSDFKKLFSAHGKMSVNWASWQNSGTRKPAPAKKAKRK